MYFIHLQGACLSEIMDMKLVSFQGLKRGMYRIKEKLSIYFINIASSW